MYQKIVIVLVMKLWGEGVEVMGRGGGRERGWNFLLYT